MCADPAVTCILSYPIFDLTCKVLPIYLRR